MPEGEAMGKSWNTTLSLSPAFFPSPCEDAQTLEETQTGNSILRDSQNLTRRGRKKPAPDAFSKQGQSLEVHFSLNYSAILWFINAVLGDAFSFSLLKQMQLDPPQLLKKWENIHIRKCSEQDTIVYIQKTEWALSGNSLEDITHTVCV